MLAEFGDLGGVGREGEVSLRLVGGKNKKGIFRVRVGVGRNLLVLF